MDSVASMGRRYILFRKGAFFRIRMEARRVSHVVPADVPRVSFITILFVSFRLFYTAGAIVTPREKIARRSDGVPKFRLEGARHEGTLWTTGVDHHDARKLAGGVMHGFCMMTQGHQGVMANYPPE